MGLLPKFTTPAVPTSAEIRNNIAGMFDRTAEAYEATGVEFFSIFAENLVADADLQPGEKVLDVGCGSGVITRRAATTVGETGSVFGIDLSSEMVARTKKELAGAGISNAEVAVMDAQEPNFGDRTFDVALSSCVLFFLPEPVVGLKAWHKAIKPGGRLAVTTFGLRDERWSDVEKVFEPYIPKPVLWTMALAAKPFATDESVAELLVEAGFTDVRSQIRAHDITFDSPDQWMQWSMSQGQRFFWELVPEKSLPEVQRKTRGFVAKLIESDGKIHLTQVVRYTIAQRP